MSRYDPGLGGVNCSHFVNGVCTAHMADGEAWQTYIDSTTDPTVACPPQYDFGTHFLIDGIYYTCRDRGGAIIVEKDGTIWLDVLTSNPKYKYGQVVSGYIVPDMFQPMLP